MLEIVTTPGSSQSECTLRICADDHTGFVGFNKSGGSVEILHVTEGELRVAAWRLLVAANAIAIADQGPGVNLQERQREAIESVSPGAEGGYACNALLTLLSGF